MQILFKYIIDAIKCHRVKCIIGKTVARDMIIIIIIVFISFGERFCRAVKQIK